MNYKKYTLVICSASFILLLLIGIINYFMDIYGVFNKDFIDPSSFKGSRFSKTVYILNNVDKYDSFIFGSSRVGYINPKIIPDNGVYYNMSFAHGLPKEHIQIINLLLRNGVNIKNLLIGLDDFSITLSTNGSMYKSLGYLHYSEEHKIDFYIKFLLYIPSYDVLKNSLFKPVPPDKIIEANPVQHINDISFKKPILHFEKYRTNDTLKELKEIQDIAEKNKINLIFFINPIHQTTYLANNLEEFNEFKQKLAAISSYYDFSGINSVTTNNYYYYETSHYRPMVGDMIIARIFGIPGIAPDDFGVLVEKTSSNFSK